MDFKNLSELRLIIYICINTENIWIAIYLYAYIIFNYIIITNSIW